jgi:hypothetical protein
LQIEPFFSAARPLGGGLQLEMDSMKRLKVMVDNRRETNRFSVNVPLTVTIGDSQIHGYTRDLSNRGVYFYISPAQSASLDREFECIVELPPEITLSTCCRIRCRARVLRKEKTPWDLSGIAAEILDYSIFRESMSIA